MLTAPEKVAFIVLALFTLGATYVSFEKMVRVVMRGQGKLRLDDLPRRLVKGAIAFITNGRIIRRRPLTSIFHLAVAWGFTFYLLVNAVDVMEGFVPDFHFLGDTIFSTVFHFLADILTVAAIIGTVYLLARRFIQKDPALGTRDNVRLHPKARKGGIATDSLLVGLFIIVHLGARLLSQSALVAAEGGLDWTRPAASLLSGLWTPAMAIPAWHINWWIALGVIFLFTPYFPYTKHSHLFVGPLNFMTRPERPAMGALEPLNFEDESIEQFGVGRLTDLHQTHIVDAFACIMCNRCQEACPAYHTGKELSPAALEINKRYYIKEHMNLLAAGGPDDAPLMEYGISDSALWACTSCGACVEVCPVGNEPMIDILQIRRNQVLMESDFPEQLKGAFTGMERLGNPWNMTDSRLAWAEPLEFEVPTVEQNPDFDVLY